MREPEKCHVEYCGYKDPRSPEELEFEILGLDTAINEAKKRMSMLKQSSFLVKLAIESGNDNSDSG